MSRPRKYRPNWPGIALLAYLVIVIGAVVWFVIKAI